jgi:hypothetical protein
MQYHPVFEPLVLCMAVAGLCGMAPAAAAEDEQDSEEFTAEFPVAACKLRANGRNAYFSLQPGYQLYLSNAGCSDCDELEEVWITVTHDFRRVQFEADGQPLTVWTRVVEERELVDGEIAEVSRNFFARCKGAGDIYYFGEDVDNYEDGEIADHEGSWIAGENGALPGIIMPGGAFLLGSRYFTEVAPGIALDRAEHVDAGEEITVPAGTFEDCVVVEDSDALEPEAEPDEKVYCPGVGLVKDEDLELIAIYGRF